MGGGEGWGGLWEEEEEMGGGGGGGGSATKRDTLSFKLEGKVGQRSKVGVDWGVDGGLGGGEGGEGPVGGVWGSQGPVSGLVFSHNVLAATQLLPQVRYLHAESGVLLLQEAGPDGDLVLLQPPGVS